MTHRPQVVFRQGLLSIRADDATIGDLLRAIESATGAKAELPDGVNDRLSVELGPGASETVLTSLLDALPYDYILVGSERQIDSIARIILISRSGSRTQQRSASDHSPSPQAPVAERRQIENTPDSNLQELKRQQELQFQQQFGACIAQRCDDS